MGDASATSGSEGLPDSEASSASVLNVCPEPAVGSTAPGRASAQQRPPLSFAAVAAAPPAQKRVAIVKPAAAATQPGGGAGASATAKAADVSPALMPAAPRARELPVMSSAPAARGQVWPAVSPGAGNIVQWGAPRHHAAPSFAAVVAASHRRSAAHPPVHQHRQAAPPATHFRAGSHERPSRVSGVAGFVAAARQLSATPSRLPDAIKAC